jgi:hypothetical protein
VGLGVAQRGVLRVERTWEWDGEGEGEAGLEVMERGRDRKVRREMRMDLRRREDMMVQVRRFAEE